MIPEKELAKLQENLVMSHACDMGDPVPYEIVRLMLLKIQSLSYDRSGIQEETLQALVKLFNYNIQPTVYELGALCASRDLAPLAHFSLELLGKRSV